VTLDVDGRRLAMLREMGLHLLPPLRAAQLAPGTADLGAQDDATLAPEMSPAPVAMRPAADQAEAVRGGHTGLESLDWQELRAAAEAISAQARHPLVFGSSPRRAHWMLVGDVPGEPEEQQGQPFAGPVGKLLDNMLRAMGLERGRDVYLTNLLKCRPPGDRNPEPGELAQWEPFLRREVALVQPRLIVLMGRFAVPTVLQTQEPIGRLRGRMHVYEGVPVVVTYHPAYLLRNLPDKAKAWTDLCLAMAALAGPQDAGNGR
jgi:uracil-DNA glycosylase family 4